jgi:hypothetical protein
MNQNHFARLAGAIALGLTSLVSAQPAISDPAQSRLAPSALRYDSAFSDYRAWQDTKPADWRRVNDALLKDAPTGSHGVHRAGPPAVTASAPATSRPGGKQ